MPKEKICKICGKPFVSNKYRPNQEICSGVECQYQRQLANMEKWRKRNPNYFKYKEANDASWKETCRRRSLEWRKRHTEYLRLYRDARKKRHRDYMREYMREYRKNQNKENPKNEK
jgi:hypothetical protein